MFYIMLRSINKMNESDRETEKARKNYTESQKRQSVVHISWFNEGAFCKWLFFFFPWFWNRKVSFWVKELVFGLLDLVHNHQNRFGFDTKITFSEIATQQMQAHVHFFSTALEMFSYFDWDGFSSLVLDVSAESFHLNRGSILL